MSAPELRERNESIVQMHLARIPYRLIGRRFDITPQRVQQILARTIRYTHVRATYTEPHEHREAVLACRGMVWALEALLRPP